MTEPVIDPATFAELQDSAGADFVAELVGTFLEEAPALLAELAQARQVGDADLFRRAAHSIKSNSQTFGALCRDLGLQGLDADVAHNQHAITALEAAYQDAAAALKEMTGV